MGEHGTRNEGEAGEEEPEIYVSQNWEVANGWTALAASHLDTA